MDADLQHDPKYIPKMFKIFINKKKDLVIGARKLTEGKNKGLSEIRRFASVILIFFFKIFNIKTSDPMSGFFLFKKKFIMKIKNFILAKDLKYLQIF